MPGQSASDTAGHGRIDGAGGIEIMGVLAAGMLSQECVGWDLLLVVRADAKPQEWLAKHGNTCSPVIFNMLVGTPALHYVTWQVSCSDHTRKAGPAVEHVMAVTYSALPESTYMGR
jgi:hypothetical protein